jgi:hypothetical protein
VSKSNLTEIVNQYVCVSNGVVHHFNLQWAATEPRWAPGHAHYVVAVEVRPEHDGPKTVHLMVPRSTSRDALLKLLAEAVEKSAWEMVLVAHGR